jgi:hypothetical protein
MLPLAVVPPVLAGLRVGAAIGDVAAFAIGGVAFGVACWLVGVAISAFTWRTYENRRSP